VAAAPVSPAERVTPEMLVETSPVPRDACWTLRAISLVAAPWLFDRRGDRCRDSIHRFDDRVDGVRRFGRRFLDAANLRSNIRGGVRRLLCKRYHFLRDDGKPLAGFSRPGRLDRGIQREQVGLAGNAVDELDDLADLLRSLCQIAHLLHRVVGVLHGLASDGYAARSNRRVGNCRAIAATSCDTRKLYPPTYQRGSNPSLL
jgi:hypothetical protein